MGYYTFYRLKVDADRADDVAAYVNANPSFRDELYGIDWDSHDGNGNFTYEDAVKWYDHDQAMTALSLAFPSVLFTLSGEGEENDDVWVSYYLAGKREHFRQPKWEPPPTTLR